MSPDALVRRSCLSVPASDRAKIDKAMSLAADEIGVDLEDFVAGDAKTQARIDLAARLPQLTLGGRSVAVRVNAAGTSWCHQDVLSPQAIDGPYLAFTEDEGQAVADRRARDLGFDGKWVIHPWQPVDVNQVFTPTAHEVERALTIQAAMVQAERDGAGAVAMDGEMIALAVVAGARSTLARAAAGSAR